MILFLLLLGQLSQGSSTGGIEGRVLDDTGAPLPQVWLQISGRALGTPVTEARTRSDGTFRLVGVPSGTYEISASLEGFQRVSLRGVRILPGRITRLSIQLVPGVLAEELHRTRAAEHPPDRDRVGAVHLREIERALPRENGLYEMLRPAPGVTVAPGGTLTIRGEDPEGTGWLLEGFSLNSPLDRRRLVDLEAVGLLRYLQVHRGGSSVRYGQHSSGLVELFAWDGRGLDRAFGDLRYRARFSAENGAADPGRSEELSGLFGGELGRYGYFLTGGLLKDEAAPGTAAVGERYRWNQGTWLNAQYRMSLKGELSVLVGQRTEWRDPLEPFRRAGYNSLLARREQLLVQADHCHRFSPERWLRVAYQFLDAEREVAARDGRRRTKRPEEYDLQATGGELPDWPYHLESRERLHRVRADYQSVLSVDHELRMGLDGELAWMDLLEGRVGDPATYPSAGIEGSNAAVKVDEGVYRIGAFLHTRWNSTKRLSILPGIRVDQYETLGKQLWLSPRFAMLYAPRPSLSLGWSIGRYVRRPALRTTIQEAANEDAEEIWIEPDIELEAVRSLQVDASAKTSITPRFRIGGAFFYRETQGRIGWSTEDQEPGRRRIVILGDAEAWGGELEMSGEIRTGWSYRLSCGATRARGPVGMEVEGLLPTAPVEPPVAPTELGEDRPLAWDVPFHWSGELDYETSDWGGFDMSLRITGGAGRPYTSARIEGEGLRWNEVNGERLDGAILVDARLIKGIPLNGPLDLALDLQGLNLLNQEQLRRVHPVTGQAFGTLSSLDTGSGRSLSAGLRLRF